MNEQDIAEARVRLELDRQLYTPHNWVRLLMEALDQALDALEAERRETARLRQREISVRSWLRPIFPDIDFDALYDMTESIGPYEAKKQ